MIDKVSVQNVNTGRNTTPQQPQPQFKGGPLDAAVAALAFCESNPMLNVAVLDLSTAIIPRTVVEAQTNPYAGLEAFRRESSGLIINCMIPGLIVAGIAKLIGKGTMGGKTGMTDCWANEDTINVVTKYWKEAEGKTDREKVENTFRKLIQETQGIDGEKTVEFKNFNFDESIKALTDNVFTEITKDNKKATKKSLSDAVSKIVEKTHVGENVKIAKHGDEYFSQSIGDVLKNAPKILKELINGKNLNVDDFAKKATKLVTNKSMLGLGAVIALALSAQPINRWITKKTSGKEGAPIYKDFTQSQVREKSPQEKAALFTQKLISASLMIGVALLSIMKKPDAKMAKRVSQFKGIFPSMDQARIISTATFVSRMMSSQDKNDLREATVRDIATFSAFYFLGDYVAKGIATGIQAWSKKHGKGIELINVLKEPDKDANALQKIWHWTKNTALKSSSEVYGKTEELTKYAKNMRGVCQLGNIAFSLVTLGLLIPIFNRRKTNKKHEEELKQMAMAQNTDNKNYPTDNAKAA